MDMNNPIYRDEAAARQHLEAIRWPSGAVCPQCGQTETVSAMPSKGSMGEGWYHCKECRQKFTVRVGNVYERSHIPLHKWVLATHLLCSSKKGMSAHQLHRMLGITYKSAWFMAHRIREAMKPNMNDPMGGEGEVIEADETYIGKSETKRPRNKYLPPPTKGRKAGPADKRVVISLVQRDGVVRTFHVARADALTVQKIMDENVKRETVLYTDESRLYTKVGKEFATHATVNHSAGEYVRKGEIHTNTVEGYFSIFKRGMKGIYQHCGEQHLHRYTTEFDFRYSNRKVDDAVRSNLAIKGAEGKRLTYRRTSGKQA